MNAVVIWSLHDFDNTQVANTIAIRALQPEKKFHKLKWPK